MEVELEIIPTAALKMYPGVRHAVSCVKLRTSFSIQLRHPIYFLNWAK